MKRYGTQERVDVVLEFIELPARLTTPGQRRREAMDPSERTAPRKRRKPIAHNAKSKVLSPLEQRIAEALEREKR